MKFTISRLFTLQCYTPNFVKIGPIVLDKMLTREDDA